MVPGNKQILNHLQFEGLFWNLEEVRDTERIVISSYLAWETTQLGWNILYRERISRGLPRGVHTIYLKRHIFITGCKSYIRHPEREGEPAGIMSITNISHIGTSSQHPCSSGLDRLIPRTSLGAAWTEVSRFDPVCIFTLFQTRIF